jgi:hypothetical protein
MTSRLVYKVFGVFIAVCKAVWSKGGGSKFVDVVVASYIEPVTNGPVCFFWGSKGYYD